MFVVLYAITGHPPWKENIVSKPQLAGCVTYIDMYAMQASSVLIFMLKFHAVA